MEPFEKTADLLGGKKVLGAIPQDPVAAAELIRAGLPPEALDSLRAKLHATLDELAEAVNLPKRTLERRLAGTPKERRGRRLTDFESERIYRFARIAARAEEVLGDIERAYRWLRKENRALGGKRPMLLLDTDMGTSAVEDVLGRIEYGVPS